MKQLFSKPICSMTSYSELSNQLKHDRKNYFIVDIVSFFSIKDSVKLKSLLIIVFVVYYFVSERNSYERTFMIYFEIVLTKRSKKIIYFIILDNVRRSLLNELMLSNNRISFLVIHKREIKEIEKLGIELKGNSIETRAEIPMVRKTIRRLLKINCWFWFLFRFWYWKYAYLRSFDLITLYISIHSRFNRNFFNI